MDVTDRGKTKVGCQKGRSALLVMLLPNATLAVYLSVRKCGQIKYRMFFLSKLPPLPGLLQSKFHTSLKRCVCACVCVREGGRGGKRIYHPAILGKKEKRKEMHGTHKSLTEAVALLPCDHRLRFIFVPIPLSLIICI